MFDFNNFLNILNTDLKDLAREHGEDFIDDIVHDGNAFAQRMRDDIQRRSQQLANGDLNREEFIWLLKSNKDLAAMEALKQKGLSVVRLNRIKNTLFDTITKSVFKSINL